MHAWRTPEDVPDLADTDHGQGHGRITSATHGLVKHDGKDDGDYGYGEGEHDDGDDEDDNEDNGGDGGDGEEEEDDDDM